MKIAVKILRYALTGKIENRKVDVLLYELKDLEQLLL